MLLDRRVLLAVVITLLLVTGCFIYISWAASQLIGSTTVPTFAFGAVVGGLLVLIWHIAATGTGAAYWAIGGRAEQWTAHELEKLGPSWRFLHGLVFPEGPPGEEWTVDVDHIAVGPYAVLAVETKFCSSPLALDATKLPKRLREDAAQAAGNAQRVRRLVHEVAPGVRVVPVLVYWGRRVIAPADVVRKVGSVRLVHGSGGAEWRQLLAARTALGPATIERISARLQEYAAE